MEGNTTPTKHPTEGSKGEEKKLTKRKQQTKKERNFDEKFLFSVYSWSLLLIKCRAVISKRSRKQIKLTNNKLEREKPDKDFL